MLSEEIGEILRHAGLLGTGVGGITGLYIPYLQGTPRSPEDVVQDTLHSALIGGVAGSLMGLPRPGSQPDTRKNFVAPKLINRMYIPLQENHSLNQVLDMSRSVATLEQDLRKQRKKRRKPTDVQLKQRITEALAEIMEKTSSLKCKSSGLS